MNKPDPVIPKVRFILVVKTQLRPDHLGATFGTGDLVAGYPPLMGYGGATVRAHAISSRT